MEKNIEIGLLYEFYNNLLTEKQAFVIDSYYNNDLSLSEIADELQISRQGVRKQIKDAEKLLFNYEEKLKLMYKFIKNKELLNCIYSDLLILENEGIKIKNLKEKINKLI